MVNLKDILDAIIDLTLDSSDATIYVHHGSIFPVVDYRMEGNILHLINFRSNDFIEDIVSLQEIINYIAVEGFEVEQVDIDCRDFEIIEERILLY